MKLGRRSFLQHSSMSALAALASSSQLLKARRARAQQAGDIPKRLVVFYVEHGTFADLATPFGSGGADFSLPRGHQALSGYEQDLVYFDNLDMVSDTVDFTGAANAHVE